LKAERKGKPFSSPVARLVGDEGGKGAAEKEILKHYRGPRGKYSSKRREEIYK